MSFIIGEMFKRISSVLRFKYGPKKNKIYAQDSTFVVSRSKKCSIVKKGYNSKKTRTKTGIKAQLVMDISNRLPARIAITAGNQQDAPMLFLLDALGKTSIRVFDKGYRSYQKFIEYIKLDKWFITPRVSAGKPKIIEEYEITERDRKTDVIADQLCRLGGKSRGYHKYKIRCITVLHKDDPNPCPHVLMTNMMNIPAYEVVEIYAERFKIEVEFHNLKQLLGASKLSSYSESGIINQWIISLICFMLIWVFERTFMLGRGFWKTAKYIKRNVSETWDSLKLPAPT